MAKERQSRAKQPIKKTDEPGIGARVGWRLLIEVIRALNGSIRTRSATETDGLITPVDKARHVTTDDGGAVIIDALSDEAMNEMVGQIHGADDVQKYLEYLELIWCYKLKAQEHATLCYKAETYYLMTELALLNGADHRDIEGYRDALATVLREGRGIEVGLDVVAAQCLGLNSWSHSNWRVFPSEPFKNSGIQKSFNALLKSAKGAKVRPLNKRHTEPTNEDIGRARELASVGLLANTLDEICTMLGNGA